MFLHWVGDHGSWLPLAAMILFIAIGALVTLYIATDRRGEHQRRMGAMAVDEAERTEAPHV